MSRTNLKELNMVRRNCEHDFETVHKVEVQFSSGIKRIMYLSDYNLEDYSSLIEHQYEDGRPFMKGTVTFYASEITRKNFNSVNRIDVNLTFIESVEWLYDSCLICDNPDEEI